MLVSNAGIWELGTGTPMYTISVGGQQVSLIFMTHLPFVPIAEKSPGPLSFRGVLPLAGAMAKY